MISSATAFHCVFQVDYGDKKHVFTDLQSWYRTTLDRMILGEPQDYHTVQNVPLSVRRSEQQQQQDN